MSLKSAMANTPATVGTVRGAQTTPADRAKALLHSGEGALWLIDAADTRKTGGSKCDLSRSRCYTVGLFLHRYNGTDVLFKCSIDSGRMGEGDDACAYAQHVRPLFPNATMPDGTSVDDAASYIKNTHNADRPQNLSIMNLQDAYKEWPDLAPTNSAE